MTKIHHAVIDGMSGAEIMGVLLDLTPEGREPPPTPRGWGRGEPRAERARDVDARRARRPRGTSNGWRERCLRRCPTSRTWPSCRRCPVLTPSAGRPPTIARLIRGGERRVLERSNLTPPRPRSTVTYRRTAVSRSASSRWTQSRRSRRSTAARSTMSCCRSAPVRCAGGCSSTMSFPRCRWLPRCRCQCAARSRWVPTATGSGC